MHIKNKIIFKTIIAFILSPYFAAILYIFLKFEVSSLKEFFILVQITVYYTYLAAIIVGIPGYIILKKINILNIYSFALLAGVTGFLLSEFVTMGMLRSGGGLEPNIRGFFSGAIAAILFWFIKKEKNSY